MDDTGKPDHDLHVPSTWNASWRVRRSKLSIARLFAGKPIRKTVADLADTLVRHDYTGPEIYPTHPPRQLSTTLAASLSGWQNLGEANAEAAFQASYCLDRILADQTREGAWLFPYPFRENGPNHPYACEILMTLSGLLDAAEAGLRTADVSAAVARGIAFLRESIGWSDDGAFWYSATDHIRVPNITSMVASVFARSALLLQEPQLEREARQAMEYCARTQEASGAYPYFTGEDLVYIPYHALQVWHLGVATRYLSETPCPSIHAALRYLNRFVRRWGYCPTNTKSSPWVAKTPLWTAMANLQNGYRQEAVRHFLAARTLFWDHSQKALFYTLDTKPRVHPRRDTIFLRYLASAFEIGSLLLESKERPS